MAKRSPALRAILGFVVLAALLALYLIAVRPWFLSWGSTAAERTRTLPGDDLVQNSEYMSMRAVTINAPPEKVWPWLAQIGQDRGGFYSYTWIENLLGAGYRNATRIHPEWQDLKAGDTVWNMPRNWRTGKFAGMVGWRVMEVDPGRYFVLRNWGVFYLDPAGEGRTRLLLRGRQVKLSALALTPVVFIFDPGHFAMEKRMMLEVKRLAEGRSGPPLWASVLAWAGFALAAAAAAGTIITRKRKWPWLALPLAYALFILIAASDTQAALVGFTALSLIIFGFVVFGRKGWLYLFWWWLLTFAVLLVAEDAFLMFGVVFLVIASGVVFMSLRKTAKA